jgi:hypothetical protein
LYGNEDDDKIKIGADQMLQQVSAIHSGLALSVSSSARTGMLLVTNGRA